MGADLLVAYIDWRRGKTSEESDLNFGKYVADIEQHIHELKEVDDEYAMLYGDAQNLSEEQIEEYKSDLLASLSCVKEAKENARDTVVITVGNRHVLITGGMSWGDSPGDTYEHISKLMNAGVL
jgi:hypothetical protein